MSLGPKDITVEGITQVTPEDVAASKVAGLVIKLIGTAKRITLSGGKSSPVGAAAALLKDLNNAF